MKCMVKTKLTYPFTDDLFFFLLGELFGLQLSILGIGPILVYRVNPYPANIFFVLKLLSAFYVCCIILQSSALHTRFYRGSKHYEPWEQSDPGPYCLQYRLPMREQSTNFVTGRKRVNQFNRHTF